MISLLDMIKCKLSTYRGGTRNHSKNNFQIAYDAISEAMEDYLNDFYSSFCFKQNAKKEINPNTELVCLCANCHRMVHRDKNQVLSVSNLRDILRENLKGEK